MNNTNHIFRMDTASTVEQRAEGMPVCGHDHDDHAQQADTAQDSPAARNGIFKRTLLGAIGLYRLTAPIRRPRCRYLPTCSEYAAEAIEVHGAGRGLWLTVRRLGRCQPFGSSGLDPVPEK